MADNESFRLFEPSNSVLLALKERVGRQSDWLLDEHDAKECNAIGPSSFGSPSRSVPSRRPQPRQVANHVQTNRPQVVPSRSSERRRPQPRSIVDDASKMSTAEQSHPRNASHVGKYTESCRNQVVRNSSKRSVPTHSPGSANIPPFNPCAANKIAAKEPLQIESLPPSCDERINQDTLEVPLSETEERRSVAEICLASVADNARSQRENEDERGFSRMQSARLLPSHVAVKGVDMPRIPSVVTFGGQPVAVEGDLVYLGGGLYAAAAPPKPREQKIIPSRPRVIPGRVQPGPHIGVGRSTSAASRPHLHAPTSNPSLHNEAPDWSAPLDSECETLPKPPRAWRPAGASKLPQPPLAEQSFHSERAYAPLSDISDGGAYSEARARERGEVRKEGGGIFGPGGLLRELERMQEAIPHTGIIGAPLNSENRASQRRAVRKLRTEKLLAQRAERVEVEAMYRGRQASSVPSLLTAPPAELSKEDLDRQKLKVACKMEMLEFFNGYASSINKLNAEESQALLEKLNGLTNVRSTPSAHLTKGSKKVTKLATQQSPGIAACSLIHINEQSDDTLEPFQIWNEDSKDIVEDTNAQQSDNTYDCLAVLGSPSHVEISL